MEIINSAFETAKAMRFLEVIAVFMGLASVIFSKKENILVYPTGIISVLIYVYLFFEVKLYADTGINLFYFGMSIYGWYNWSRKSKDTKIDISKNTRNQNILVIVSILILWYFLYFLLSNYTDSDVAHIDSYTTAVCFVGMWLMTWKRIENWIMWIIADVVSVPLYWYKELYLTSFQFVIFIILSVLGYMEWKKKLHKN